MLLCTAISFCFLSCSKDEECSINTTSISLTSDGTYALIVSPSGDGWTFESENDLIASVSSTGLITANYVGTTTIIVKNEAKGFSAKCTVTVNPIYLMFREPSTNFGATKSTIKAFEKRSLYKEDVGTLTYLGENAFITSAIYLFENSILTGSGVQIPTSFSSLVGSFYGERYIYLYTSDSNIITMISPDYKTIVGIEVYSISYIFVVYFKNTYITRNSISKRYPVEIKEITSKIQTMCQRPSLNKATTRHMLDPKKIEEVMTNIKNFQP